MNQLLLMPKFGNQNFVWFFFLQRWLFFVLVEFVNQKEKPNYISNSDGLLTMKPKGLERSNKGDPNAYERNATMPVDMFLFYLHNFDEITFSQEA